MKITVLSQKFEYCAWMLGLLDLENTYFLRLALMAQTYETQRSHGYARWYKRQILRSAAMYVLIVIPHKRQ